MGLFKRGEDDPDKALAKALVLRGERVEGEMLAMRETGEIKGDGLAKEFEMTFRFTPLGEPAPREVTVRQFFNDTTRTGLEAGAPATIWYDRDDPLACIVDGSPRYRITKFGAVPADAAPLPDEFS